MFTGIIEEIGKLRNISGGADSCVISVGAQTVLEGTKLGDSIAVNGVCLTVINMTDTAFDADVSVETLNRTSLKQLKTGASLNLERALRLQDRLGGHIVSGHIDGIGKISKLVKSGAGFVYEISADKNIIFQLVEKGSVAIEGISLTISNIFDTSFEVSVIPHTRANTNLVDKKPGDIVNLECDIIGKYVIRHLDELADVQGQNKRNNRQAGGLTSAFLAENGFF